MVMRSIKDIFHSYAEFDDKGRHINGCDKESNHHYGDAYEKIFTFNNPQEDTSNVIKLNYPYSYRKDIKLMMEIGVADGSSLLAWQEIFPNAHIVGMDIHPAAKWNGEFHLGDQCSITDCIKAVNGRQFDVIVEDATHLLENSLQTLLYMWPYVKSGGLYIIEEFSNIGVLKWHIKKLYPFCEIVNTVSPFGGDEPLLVFRKNT